MPRSFVLHGEPNRKTPEKSRSLHYRGSNDPCASREGKPSKAAKWKPNAQMRAWEGGGSDCWKVQATQALLPAPQCVTQASSFHFCLPQFPRTQHREVRDCSRDASALPGFGTAAQRGLKPPLQCTCTHTHQSVVRINAEFQWLVWSTREYQLHLKATLVPSNERGGVLCFKSFDFLVFQRAESSKKDREVAQAAGKRWGARLRGEAELPRQVRGAQQSPREPGYRSSTRSQPKCGPGRQQLPSLIWNVSKERNACQYRNKPGEQKWTLPLCCVGCCKACQEALPPNSWKSRRGQEHKYVAVRIFTTDTRNNWSAVHVPVTESHQTGTLFGRLYSRLLQWCALPYTSILPYCYCTTDLRLGYLHPYVPIQLFSILN